MANLDEYATVFGEAFKFVTDDEAGRTNFTVKSYVTAKYINATLWHNSHGHLVDQLENGIPVLVTGKLKKTPKKDGDGFWLNLSVYGIASFPLDKGIRDDQPASSASGDDEPDVL